MLFHSFSFILLFIITFIIYYLFSKLRIYILAIIDMIFYGASGLGFLILFITISYIVYICALLIHRKKKCILVKAGIVICLFNLLFFKYSSFLAVNITHIANVSWPILDNYLSKIIMPVGISFYTFQLIAYIIDVKKKIVEPCKSFLEFWVFISFFAQLIAGPIMRGKDLLPQIQALSEKRLKTANIRTGIFYIILGFAKKLMLADMLAPKVDYYFANVMLLNSLDSWFAAYLFAFQIYFDFSAYCDMALGLGYMLDLSLDINFMTPYLSGNPEEFWKRWHITLSRWIRDYIYIPLGGARKGLRMQFVFLLTALTISGLWHGAAWTFVIWGIYHGFLGISYKAYKRVRVVSKQNMIVKKIYKIISVMIYFNLVVIGFVIFRANTIRAAFDVIWKMISLEDISFSPLYILYFSFIALLYILHILENYLLKYREAIMSQWETNIPPALRAAVYVILLFLFILFTKTEQSSFIYFQF